MTPKEAFNVVVRYSFCGDCRFTLEDDNCVKYDCYQRVKFIKEAIEKQEKKKPTEYVDHKICIDWICPTCERFHRTEWRTKHCSDCGQAIDWSEEV